MQTRPLGKTGVHVSSVGYGAQFLSVPGHPPEADALALLRQVVARGVTFVDTADTYCTGPAELHHNERLVARALRAAGAAGEIAPGAVHVATKGGTVRTEDGWEIGGSPQRLYRAICDSHQALGGREPIFLWLHHWPDPRHAIADVMKSVRRAVDEKLVRFVGVSNYSLQQVREARDVVDVACVQNQYNLWNPEAARDGMLEYCERHGLSFIPWRPMGGPGLAERLGEVRPLAEMARERGISPQRFMIAWHLAKSSCVLAIPGSTKLPHVLDCLAAADVWLEPDEVARLDGLTPDQLPRRARPPRWKGSLALSRDTAASEP